MISSKEIDFNKYRLKGAYHWRQYYGQPEEIDFFLKGRYDFTVNLLKKYGIIQSKKLLEVGCGDGALLSVIKKSFNCEVVGIDTSSEALEMALREFRARGIKGVFFQVNGYTYPFLDSSFDVAVCADVIEHVAFPEKLLNEMSRIVKKNGLVIITTPIRTSQYPIDSMHVQEWFPEEFNELCRKHIGIPTQDTLSHPIFWYELYMAKNRWIRIPFKKIMHKLDLAGRSIFLPPFRVKWRFFMMQTLLIHNSK